MIRVGIAGAGFIGRVHAQSVDMMDNAVLSGIFDKNLEAAKSLAQLYNSNFFETFEELLDNSDVVILAIPTPYRKDFLELSIKKGKHVFCEKPLARTIEEAYRIKQIVKASKVKFMVDHVVRFFPEYRKIHDMILEGKVGDVSEVRSFRGGPFPGWSNWFKSFQKSGGVLLDLAIHDIDFWSWTLGEVQSIKAYALDFSESIERDHGVVIMKFRSGAIAHIEATWAYPKGSAFRTMAEVVGSNGRAKFDSESFNPLTIYSKNSRESLSPHSLTPWGVALKEFLKAVENDTEVPVSVDDGVKAVELSLKAIDSAKTGETKVVKL